MIKELKNRFRNTIKGRMKQIIYILGYVLYATKLYKAVMFLRRHSMKILVYHEISDRKNPFTEGLNITLDTDTFRKQMLFLSRYYKIVNLDTIVRHIERRQRGSHYVAITFDDAYKSFVENALPILSDMGFQATIFLIGRCVIDGRLMWRNELAYIINDYPQRAREAIYNIIKESDGDFANAVLQFSQEELIKRSADIAGFLRPATIDAFMRNIEGEFEIPKEELYLTAEECRGLSNNGIDFGNHSYSHWDFAHLSRSEIDKETQPWHGDELDGVDYGHSYFAFPFGRPLENQRTIEKIAEGNDISCLFFANGLDNNSNTSPYKLGRHHLSSSEEHRIFAEMELFPLFRKVMNKLPSMVE